MLDADEEAVDAIHVVRVAVQVERDRVMIEVVVRRARVRRQEPQDALVERRPLGTAQLLDPVRGRRERHGRVGIGLLGCQIADRQQAGELFVGAGPRVSAATRVAGAEIGLVPDDPIVDLPRVLAHRLVHEAAPVVLRVVKCQVQILGH